jgi:uncharacterized protein YcfL
MKLHIILIALFFIACSSKKEVSINKHLNSDTLMINNVVYYLDSISEEEYKTVNTNLYWKIQNLDSIFEEEQKTVHKYLYWKFKIDTIIIDTTDYNREIIDDPLHVKRDNLKLTFQLKNGKVKVLLDDTTSTSESPIKYGYIESFKKLDYWEVEYLAWGEDGGSFLIDKETGEEIYLWSPWINFIISPNNKYLISNSATEPGQGEWERGLQLYEIKNKKVYLKWERKIEKWIIEGVVWKNDTTIYMATKSYYYNIDSPIYSYKSMVTVN